MTQSMSALDFMQVFTTSGIDPHTRGLTDTMGAPIAPRGRLGFRDMVKRVIAGEGRDDEADADELHTRAAQHRTASIGAGDLDASYNSNSSSGVTAVDVDGEGVTNPMVADSQEEGEGQREQLHDPGMREAKGSAMVLTSSQTSMI